MFVSTSEQAARDWPGWCLADDAAKAGAGLLGWRGRERQDTVAAIEPHQWIYADTQPGNAGPVLVTT